MTTKPILTETQRQVLERAADHPLNEVAWFPDTVKGGARTKVLTALASKGWITECRGHWFLASGAIAALERDVPPPIPTMPMVLEADDANTRADDAPATTCATDDATTPGQSDPLEVLVEEISYSELADDEIDASHNNEPPVAAAMAVKPLRTRENSKQATVIAMLKRPEGATVAQICASTGWLAHTARGCLAGALKKKLGLTITSEKAPGGERTYRIG